MNFENKRVDKKHMNSETTPNQIVVSQGVITFENWISKRQISTVLSNQIAKKLIYKNTWELQHLQFHLINDTEIFSIVSELRIERLNLSPAKNRHPNMIREIKQISFPLLTRLLLNDNHISSIQFLDHLDCPHLQALSLMNNKLVHVKAFKKTKFLNLNFVALEKNFIQNFQPLCMTKSDNFNQLIIETDNKKPVLGHDISWLSKIDSPEFKELFCKQQKRINQSKIKQMLLNKFTQLNICDKFQQISE